MEKDVMGREFLGVFVEWSQQCNAKLEEMYPQATRRIFWDTARLQRKINWIEVQKIKGKDG